MRKNGFTLVELLIVFGIIAVLAGIGYFVYSNIREKILLAHCLNNLKQIGLALRMYAQDHNGFAPPYTNDVGPPPPRIFPNANDPNLFEAAYARYAKSKEVFFCPIDPLAGKFTLTAPDDYPPYLAQTLWNEINHKATSYRINFVCATIGLAPILVDNPPTPEMAAKVIGYILGNWRVHGRIEYAADHHHSFDFSNGAWRDPPNAPYLFFDGSVRVRRER